MSKPTPQDRWPWAFWSHPLNEPLSSSVRVLSPLTWWCAARRRIAAAAQALWRELRTWDGTTGLTLLAGHACLQLGPFTLVACRRDPGQPYAPLEARPADLVALEEAIGPVVDLGSGSPLGREVYFNMRHFERS
jgi:hypothetical protein